VPRPDPIARADIGRLSSFRLPARADELVVLDHSETLRGLDPPGPDDLVLGGGSNTVFVGDIRGLVLLNRLRGCSFQSDGDHVLVTAAAGENWHRLVRRCLDAGLHGLENLALIPGSVGAAPMQNIGAYGVELADLFEQLEAWDFERRDFVRLRATDCAFAYRDSRFKSGDHGRFLITSVTLRLSRRFKPKTGYDSLAGELGRLGIARADARQLTAAVMRLRRHRLPDPSRLPNAGSFFKNPIVETDVAATLTADHPGLPHWPLDDGRVKIGAGRLIETLGWKGKRVGDAGVYPNHALVLVNHGQATASQLMTLIDRITDSVEREFGLRLEPEPRLVGQ
jgi:UDP-N-acetylmuramate dehydrogenase